MGSRQSPIPGSTWCHRLQLTWVSCVLSAFYVNWTTGLQGSGYPKLQNCKTNMANTLQQLGTAGELSQTDVHKTRRGWSIEKVQRQCWVRQKTGPPEKRIKRRGRQTTAVLPLSLKASSICYAKRLIIYLKGRSRLAVKIKHLNGILLTCTPSERLMGL